MRKAMLWPAVLALLVWAAPLAGADVTGKWVFDVQLDMGSGSPTFVFEQVGETLTGTYNGALGSAALKGSVKGDRIEFTFDSDFGKVQYSGTVESKGTMKGKCDYGGQASGTWTAKRTE